MEIVISQNYAQVLGAVLQFYWHFMLYSNAPSAKRSREVIEVQLLIVKINLLPCVNLRDLTIEELGHMKAALNTLISQAKQRVPETRGRDETIASCERIRDDINEAMMLKG